MFLVCIQKFRTPEFLIAEEIRLAGFAASEREPLHFVRERDVVETRIIERRVDGGRGNNGDEMCWEFFRGRPLVEPGVGAAPHPDFAVAEGLHAKPFDHVMAVARLLGEWLEVAAGI